MAKKEEVTMFMVLLALFDCLLSRLGGGEDIIVGTIVAGRRHTDLEKIIGMFVNTLALRNYPGGHKTFIEFLREVKQGTLGAFDNQDYPFEELVEKVLKERDPARNPLFDVLFSFAAQDPGEISADRDEAPEPGNGTDGNAQVKFDMIFTGKDTGRHLDMVIAYSTKLFTKKTIEGYIEYFKKIVTAVVENETVKLKDLSISTTLSKTGEDTLPASDIEFEF